MSILSNAERFHDLIKRNLWGMAIGGVCLFGSVKILATITQANAAPIAEASCATATDVAALICTTPKLTALKEDMAQAAMRAGQTYRFSLNAQRELEQLIPQLIGMRSAAAGSDGVGLEVIMEYQRNFLTSLDAPRSGKTGRWVNALGALTITETANGVMVELSASEPARNEWRCDLKIIARPDLSGLRANGDASNSPLEGWSLRARREGPLLRIEETAPEGSTGERPYCKGGGGFFGTYFPAR